VTSRHNHILAGEVSNHCRSVSKTGRFFVPVVRRGATIIRLPRIFVQLRWKTIRRFPIPDCGRTTPARDNHFSATESRAETVSVDLPRHHSLGQGKRPPGPWQVFSMLVTSTSPREQDEAASLAGDEVLIRGQNDFVQDEASLTHRLSVWKPGAAPPSRAPARRVGLAQRAGGNRPAAAHPARCRSSSRRRWARGREARRRRPRRGEVVGILYPGGGGDLSSRVEGARVQNSLQVGQDQFCQLR
jgi:hypothetical protein